jgi:hypothetical protein
MVEIRDRRDLPFFQVRFTAVSAIRAKVGGPKRVRAIGFYALLCQLANEQRHTGEHRVIRVNYDELAGRGQMSKHSVKTLLGILVAADVVRYERLADPDRGATISLLHLLVHDGQWTPFTVAMAEGLAQDRPGGYLLRDLGLVVILLEFCARQREQHGGLRAEVMRADIAERTGLTADRIDDCNRVLEEAGVLEITRRRGANGGRYLSSVYTILEAVADDGHGGVREPAGRRDGTGKAESEHHQGGAPVLTTRRDGTGKAENGYRQGGISATDRADSPGSYARTGVGVETAIEEHPPLLSSPDSGPSGEITGPGGRGGAQSAEEQLCQALVAAWEPALGDIPRGSFDKDRSRWLKAAEGLLQRHPRERLDLAIVYMVGDEILGSEALTMPGFAKVADRLIARAHARRVRLGARGAPAVAGAGIGWQDAKSELEQAIKRHGRDGRAAALSELARASPLLARFVERVRWTELCEQPMRYVERQYADIWAEITQQANETTERAA